MLIWVLIGLAIATPPDKLAAEFSLGSGTPADLSVSDELVAVPTAESTLAVLDLEDWSVLTSSVCSVTGAVADGGDVYVGCDDGEVHQLTLSDGALAAATDDDDEAVVWALSEDEDAAEAVLDLFVVSDILYAVAEVDDVLYLHKIDPYADTVDSGGYPVQLIYDGYVDAVGTATRMVVAHGSDDITTVLWGATSPISPSTRLGVSLEDIAGTARDSIVGVDSNGFVVEYQLSSFQWLILFNDLDEPTAVGISTVTDDEFMVLGDDLTAKVYAMSAGAIADDEPTESFALTEQLVEIEVGDGYTYALTGDGGLAILTAAPWVSDVTVTPTLATAGDELTVVFTTDESGDYEVLRGGDRTGTGEVLASGSAAAGTHEVILTVDGDWDEGDNAVYVRLTDGDGNTGHGASSVNVDNPPDPPELTDAAVGFSDGGLILSFAGIGDADLDHYTVYVTTTVFTGDDWPTGGPDFDGDDALEAPVTVTAAGGDSVSLTLEPLTNGVTYYIGVRATDAGGLEGAMSNVIEGTPRPAYSAAELAGETGGRPECGPGLAGVGWLVLLGAAALTRRRRWVAAGAALALTTTAWGKDYTPTRGDFELRYGPVTFQDSGGPVEQVYGKTGHEVLMMEFGPQLFRVLEFDVGIGFYQELAWTIDASGAASSDRAMLTWWPAHATGTFRLQLLDEQFLVPYASYGVDYLMWSELTGPVGGDKSKLKGAKFGTHWALGGNLLLDTFAPARASTLEAQTGINDTFLVVDWRRVTVGDGTGLDLSGTWLTIGLKLDY